MPSRRDLPPVVIRGGVGPSHAAMSRPRRNARALPTAAASAVALMVPIPESSSGIEAGQAVRLFEGRQVITDNPRELADHGLDRRGARPGHVWECGWLRPIALSSTRGPDAEGLIRPDDGNSTPA
jgi:hypothetical protein